jgi:peptidoglycan/LPS O-acetylase OafA/YrhL
MQFYAAFPIIYLLLKRRSVWWMFALGIVCVAGGVAYRVGVAEFGWLPFREPSFLLFKLPVFIAGMLIYEAGRAETRIAPLLLACALLVIEYRWAGPASFFLWALIGSLIGTWVGRREAWVDRLSHWPIVTFASDCSYSVYLFHSLILTTLGAPLLVFLLQAGWRLEAAVAVLTVFVVGAVYPISYAVYRLIEQPGIRIGSRVEKSLAKRRSTWPLEPALTTRASERDPVP